MQTPNINFCLAAPTLVANSKISPSRERETNSVTPLFSRPLAYLYRTRSDELVRESKLPRYEERARDIEQTTN